MTNTTTLSVVEVGGRSIQDLEDIPRCEIRSHFFDNELVVLQVCNQVVTLKAREIFAATHNATNIPRR